MLIRRTNKFNETSLLSVYRPCIIDELIGQETTKNIIKNGLDKNTLPHSLLLSGRAGTGKTTTARIISLGLNCESSNKPTSKPCLECNSCMEILKDISMDVVEVNVGKDGGKSEIDSIISKVDYAPIRLRYKVIIFDEAHKLTPAARDLLLKPIEDGISHVYYIFCTNQIEKLKSADKDGGNPFIDRCSTLLFRPLPSKLIYDALENICVFEGIEYHKDVLQNISEECEGIPRKAINWLEQVIIDGSWTIESLNNAIDSSGEVSNTNIFKICSLLNNGDFINGLYEYERLKTDGAEGVRIKMFMYFLKCLKTANTSIEADRFSRILDLLDTPIYESGKVADMYLSHLFYKISRIN